MRQRDLAMFLAVEQPRGRSLRARSSLIECAALAGWN
jgi:hypothetical protein